MKITLASWTRKNRIDILVVSILLIIATFVSAFNMANYPQRFEDEGTYISQAWAIEERGALAHYTYWYDHPPVGWIQIAGYNTATRALDRHDSAITAGREFMLFIHIISVLLIYAIARRLGLGVIASSIATLAYSLSPLVVEFSRYLLLDNVAMPWLLGAYLLALSPKRDLLRAVSSGALLAIAVLSKETVVVLLPVVLYALWSRGDKRNRRFTILTFITVFSLVTGLYLLYATLKNELIPGVGHVSLLGSFWWQLFGREGSGSILDPASNNRGLVKFWLNIDHWLLYAGFITMPIGIFLHKVRIAALSLLINSLLLFRTGYLPFPLVIVFLPFAALTFSGVLETYVIRPITSIKSSPIIRVHAVAAAVALVIATSIYVVPDWQSGLKYITTHDNDRSSREMVNWIEQNVSPLNNRIVVESALWTDLIERGFNQPEPVWLYKTETDPEIIEEIGGWQGIDYVVLNGPTLDSPLLEPTFPTVATAIENGELAAEFGETDRNIRIYKVNN